MENAPNRVSIWTIAAFVAALIVLALVLPRAFVSTDHPAPSAVCIYNLRAQACALHVYCDENNDHYPPSHNWCNVVRRYWKMRESDDDAELTEMLTCPSLPAGEVGGYAYNLALSEAEAPRAGEDASELVMVFESRRGLGLCGGRELLLKQPRHPRGVNLAFADGHVARKKTIEARQMTWSLPKIK